VVEAAVAVVEVYAVVAAVVMVVALHSHTMQPARVQEVLVVESQTIPAFVRIVVDQTIVKAPLSARALARVGS